MVEKIAEGDRFNWWLPFYAAAGALLVFLPVAIYGDGLQEILYFFLAVPLIAIALLVGVIRRSGRRRLSVLSMLAVYCAVSWVLLERTVSLRGGARWVLRSPHYKAEILAQPSRGGDLKHTEWERWGSPGSGDIIMYLVFDPDNSLAAAARRSSGGYFRGIPCKVSSVHRMQCQWYLVIFYVDTTWDQCGDR